MMSPCVLAAPCSRLLLSAPVLRSSQPTFICTVLMLLWIWTLTGLVQDQRWWWISQNNGLQSEELSYSLSPGSLDAICLLESLLRTRNVCLHKGSTCSCSSPPSSSLPIHILQSWIWGEGQLILFKGPGILVCVFKTLFHVTFVCKCF